MVAVAWAILAYDAFLRVARWASLRACPTTYARLTPAERRQWDALLPSAAHAVFVASGAACILLVDHFRRPATASAGWTSPTSTAVLAVSLGYFLADLVRAALPAGGALMIAHHALSAATLAGALWTGWGHVHVLAILLSEATTPFINARQLLKQDGREDSRAYLVNGIAIAATWLVARVLLFAAYFWIVWRRGDLTNPAVPAWVRQAMLVLPLLLGAMNIYWFWLILRALFRRLRPPTPPVPPPAPPVPVKTPASQSTEHEKRK